MSYVVVKEPGKHAEKKEVGDVPYEMIHECVGGYIELIPIIGIPAFITAFCCEDGKHDGMLPNIHIPGDVVVGNIFVCARGHGDSSIGMDLEDADMTIALLALLSV